MGCGSSSGSRSRASEPRVSRNAYYDGHPGLHNKPTDNIESEIVTRVRAPDPNDTVTINVKKIDLNVTENCQAHFTDEYDIALEKKLLVIRRGQSFDVDIEFNREYDRARDDLRIVFRFGKSPRPRRSTHVELILSDTDQKGHWGAHLKSKNGNSVKITIVSPPNCLVGKWKLNIDVVKRFESVTSVCRHEHPDPIYILFNPWCEADTVYMHETSKLKEYVLNSVGRIFRGSSRKVSPKMWSFGQFEDNILDCAMYLLDEMLGISDNARGDPIPIVRRISAVVNSPNDGGVLVGNWSGEYPSGTSPLDWNGSVEILEQFYKTKSPVKYGQCWVFSGVVTTLCRTLGIPARSVTNFVSAHDTDKSITIDTYFDEEEKKVKELNSDSVWNFHVWNDVWMARPDLPQGFGGWQAIDATPQETSDGVYCLGPTSLQAIKHGEVYLPYDAPFVFAEVNADRLVWMVRKDDTCELKRTIKNSIGKFLLSNGLSEDRILDNVTWDYKFKEGSEEERAAVKKANMSSEMVAGIYDTGPEDVDFEPQITDDTFMGDTVVIKLKVKNQSSEERTIDGRITVSSMYYTGVHFRDIHKNEINSLVLQANEVKEIPVEIEESGYLDLLMDHCMLKVSCLCLVQQTNQAYFETEELRLRKPHLNVTASDSAKVGSPVEVETTFTNPLNVNLTGCQLRIEGPGLRKPLTQMYGNVDPKKKFVGKFDLTPAKRGNREVVVNFSCNQIRSVNGSHKILIE